MFHNFFLVLQVLLFIIISISIGIINVIDREVEKILKYVEIDLVCNVIRQSMRNVTLRLICEIVAVGKECCIRGILSVRLKP